MKLRDTLLRPLAPRGRAAVVLLAAALTLAIGYLHLRTGLAYEFHVLFVLPVLLATWLVGGAAGYGIAVLAVALWFAGDHQLGGQQSDPTPLLFNTGMRLAMFVFSAWLVAHIRSLLDREVRLAREDPLTRLPNRREFFELGRLALAQSHRQGEPFTAVFIDLDKFKQVNDTRGHKAGDRLLRTVGRAMREHVRATDIPGRLGGDEFALLLPGMDPSAAWGYADNLRQRLLAAMHAHEWPVTFSVGVASCRLAPRDLDRLMEQADELMYEVKKDGGDRILWRTYREAEL